MSRQSVSQLGNKRHKLNASSEAMPQAIEFIGDCYSMVQLCKSEVIHLVEKKYSGNKPEPEEIKIQPQIPIQTKDEPEELSKSQTMHFAKRSDYRTMGTLGQGSYGRVYLAEKDDYVYALKEVSKTFILNVGKAEAVFRERDLLSSFNHPAFPKLYSTFQDQDFLYFAMEYVPNGSLAFLLESYGRMTRKLTKLYAAQLVSAVGYIHSQSILHRDLKPQNILLDKNHFIKIIDFGEAKQMVLEQDPRRGNSFRFDTNRTDSQELSAGSFGSLFRKDSERFRKPSKASPLKNNLTDKRLRQQGTFVGTPLYAAPEMLENNSSSKGTDLWALGCIIYQLFAGFTPFQNEYNSGFQVFSNILERRLTFPPHFDDEIKDLIDKLLAYQPEERLGYYNIQHLKEHPFFGGIDFNLLDERSVEMRIDEYTRQDTLQTMVTNPDEDDEAKERCSQITFKETDGREESFDFTILQDDSIKQTKEELKQIELKNEEGNESPIILQGAVKIKCNLLFKKKKWLQVRENGKLEILKRKNGIVEEKIQMHSKFNIKQIKMNRITVSYKKLVKEIESDDAGVWVCILDTVKLKNKEF